MPNARQHGLPRPVLLGKARTDESFEELSVELLRSPDLFLAGLGSHNARSVAVAVAAARGGGLAPGALEIQMLLGMAEPQCDALRDMGLRVRVYSPISDLLPGIAYLVRRLLESTANAGFLRMTWHDNEDPDVLLARPTGSLQEGAGPAMVSGDPATLFENCPHADLTDARVRAGFRSAVDAAPRGFPVRVPVAIGGIERLEGSTLERVCSGDVTMTVSRVTLGTRADAERAVHGALDAWPGRRDTPVRDRAVLLDRLADRLEADRAALECFEVSKPLREADADVAEAIDFCRYYARGAVRELPPTRLGDIPGEENVLS